jgi:hypothetical protein
MESMAYLQKLTGKGGKIVRQTAGIFGNICFYLQFVS